MRVCNPLIVPGTLGVRECETHLRSTTTDYFLELIAARSNEHTLQHLIKFLSSALMIRNSSIRPNE